MPRGLWDPNTISVEASGALLVSLSSKHQEVQGPSHCKHQVVLGVLAVSLKFQHQGAQGPDIASTAAGGPSGLLML